LQNKKPRAINLYFIVASLFMGVSSAYFLTSAHPLASASIAARIIFGVSWLLFFFVGLWLARFWRYRLGVATAVTAVIITIAVTVPVPRDLKKSKAGRTIIGAIAPARKRGYKQREMYNSPIITSLRNNVIPHLGMFSVLGFVARLALVAQRGAGEAGGRCAGRGSGGSARNRAAWLQALAGLLLFAAGTEVLQFVTRTRSPGAIDFSLNVIGLALGLTAARVLESRLVKGAR